MFAHFAPRAHAAVEAAKAAAREQGVPQLGLEHLLLGLLRTVPDLPVPAGLGPPATLAAQLAAQLPRGAGSGEASLQATAGAVAAIRRADTLMTERGDSSVLPWHLLAAVLEGLAADPALAASVTAVTGPLEIWRALATPVAAGRNGASAAAPGPERPGTPNLDRYSRDMTALATQGALTPLFGREQELRSLMEVLCKITKNNPALVGEPGVGKTALVEGLAQRIAAGRVPAPLRGRRLVALDLNALLAGTRYRGDFEERLHGVLDEVQRARALLFIDELHTVIGAGDAEGRGDLANVLKPYLTSGTVSVIGATTTSEYRRYIERDGALERRFQPLPVAEPSPEATLAILRSVRARFETHYQTTIPDVVLQLVVDLTRQYLRHRYFPDKALDVLQLACARALLDSIPDTPDMAPPPADPGPVAPEHVRAVVAELVGVPLEHFAGNPALAASYLDLESILGDQVFGQPVAIGAIANAMRLAKRQLDLNPLRPDGVFLFLGPPGVGKTELSRALGRFLFGDEQHVIQIDMTEFSEPHSVSRLIGSPPGYVGFDDGGQLTEKIRTNPFSLLVLDELEKAHPAVVNLFLQVFDDGRLTDSHGRTTYFSDVTVVLTSNAGAEHFAGRALGFTPSRGGRAGEGPGREISPDAALSEARKHFPAELLGRIDKVIVFQPLSRDAARRIVDRKLHATLTRIVEGGTLSDGDAPVPITYEPAVVDYVVRHGFSPEWGARHVERAIEELVLAPLARETFRSDWPRVRALHLAIVDGGLQVETTEDRVGGDAAVTVPLPGLTEESEVL